MQFCQSALVTSSTTLHSVTGNDFMIHRVNLTDAAVLVSDPGQRDLVGSKSGIAILDSSAEKILLPPGSSVEVDFWVFGEDQVLLTHHNPLLSQVLRYPTLEQFMTAWNHKRQEEKNLGVAHGEIVANLKTHGGEERLIELFAVQGIPLSELVFLDQEYPATDRLLRSTGKGSSAPVAVRVSRIESLQGVLLILEQPEVFSAPRAVFFDPIGSESEATAWPFEKAGVERMYSLAPRIEFMLCCPSRWGRDDQIEPLARRCQQSGLRRPVVMTDIDKIARWQPVLESWPK